MKYRVELSARAEHDIDGALAWLFSKGVSPATAGRWHQRLLSAVATLERGPQRCGLASEAGELAIQLRELLFGRRPNVYRILFVVEQRTVNILHIRHAARDLVRRGDLF